jgi:hypothetical protein
MKLGIREKITVVICIGMEVAFMEGLLQLGNRSLWEFIEPFIPALYF